MREPFWEAHRALSGHGNFVDDGLRDGPAETKRARVCSLVIPAATSVS